MGQILHGSATTACTGEGRGLRQPVAQYRIVKRA